MLIDIINHQGKLICWNILSDKSTFYEVTYKHHIYAKPTEELNKALNYFQLKYISLSKKDIYGKLKKVYKIYLDKDKWNFQIKQLEKKCKYDLELYNADITPERAYILKNNLSLFETKKGKHIPSNLEIFYLKIKKIRPANYDSNLPLKSIEINGRVYVKENEKKLIQEFVKIFNAKNPDIIICQNGYQNIPYLVERAKKHNIQTNFNRYGEEPTYKGSKSFHTYGQIKYRAFKVKLKGRILIDSNTSIGSQPLQAIIEIANLSKNTLQDTISKTPGAIFSSTVDSKIYEDNALIPYKQKPVEYPLTFEEFLKADRTGHTFNPKIGLTKNIVEIDFSSMFPWLIYNYNLSAETFKQGNKNQKIPTSPFSTNLDKKGYTARAIKPYLDKRMQCKQNGDKAKAKSLKQILVSSYGYLRFREFKLGTPQSYMSICAAAREIILDAFQIAEKYGYETIHGVIDSIYIHKNEIKTNELSKLVNEITLKTGIPLETEKYEWMLILPSINNPNIPVPTKYIAKGEKTKYRGIEIRQKNMPPIVKDYQKKCIEILEKNNFDGSIKPYYELLTRMLNEVKDIESYILQVNISKKNYKNNVVQKKLVNKLNARNIQIEPGQTIHYVQEKTSAKLLDEAKKPDKQYYMKLMLNSLKNILGFNKQMLKELNNKHFDYSNERLI